MKAPVVTLTTDWGYKDHYAGAVKGRLISACPGVQVVDISHGIPPFHHSEAAFILDQSFRHFPEGSIHIIGVDTVADTDTPHCVIKAEGHYFIGADNGIFSLLFGKNKIEIHEIEINQNSDYFTFSTRDVFVNAACMLAQGKELKEIGSRRTELNEKFNMKAIVSEDSIKGQVILVDSFNNVITNISKEIFQKQQNNRNFLIEFSGDNKITEIHTSYDDVPQYELVALFGSSGYLEIALNEEKASELLGLNINDEIVINFS